MNNKIEVWRDIKGYEGYYQISDFQRIKSIERMVKHWRGGLRRENEKILKQVIDSKGYLCVSLSKNGKSKRKKIHQLIAEAFMNHIIDRYSVIVDHIDNNKLNNKIDNLQLISPRENVSKDIKGCSSKYTGVAWDTNRKKWRVHMYFNGKNNSLGRFDDELEASKVYQDKLKEIENGNIN